MKRGALIPAIVLFLGAGLLNAHGGGLDRNGGHYNRKTGVYHCHRCPCGCEQRQGRSPAAPGKRRKLDDSSSLSAGQADAKVWVNTTSGVYHCPGARWYGGTNAGRFMTQKEAQDSGFRPAYGKLCT
jgi:hypothetical protein